MKNSEKLLAKLKQKGIKPIPRWHFVLKNIAFWLMFIFSVKLGAMAVSVIIFAITNSEFDILSHLNHSKFEFFLGMLPLLWIIFAGFFLLGAYKLFQKTKTGYRYSPMLVVGASFVFSLIFGTILFFAGGAEKIEEKFAGFVPVYHSLESRRVGRWSHPELGLLSGEIVELQNQKSLKLRDFSGKVWQISYDKAEVKKRVQLKSREKIKLIGEKVGEDIFKATEIRPWGGFRKKIQNNNFIFLNLKTRENLLPKFRNK